MIFFLNIGFGKQNSGIEHAQMKRALLFRNHNEPFKLVFREWRTQIHTYLKKVGISNDEVLNMFDFFQKAEKVKDKIITIKDINFGYNSVEVKKDSSTRRYIIKSNGRLVAHVRYFWDDPDERVQFVEFFDSTGNFYRVDNYDFRGFLSMVQYYTPDNKIGTEVWYDLDGKPVLESYNRYNRNKKLEKTNWRLITSKGIYLYSTIEELASYFFNAINEKYWDGSKPNIFVMDRPAFGEIALKNLKRPAYTVLHLHNAHLANARDPEHSNLNDFYEYSLYSANSYDAIISATRKQTDDVKARFHPQSKLFTIPVGIIPDKQLNEKKVPMNERIAGRVLATARIAPEKQLHLLVEAVGMAKKEVPNISLALYGYSSKESLSKINEIIKKYDLKDQVFINNYSDDVATLQKQAQVYGLTSSIEGFNLALLEALSRGTVGITHEVNYGPSELVVDGENGYVLPYGDVRGIAEKLIELFTHPDLLQKMSDTAYALSERYSEANVWAAWKVLLEDSKSKKLEYCPDVIDVGRN